AVARIWKLIWAIGAAGAVALVAWRGWWWGAGWVIGTAVSALNFRGLKQLGEAIGGGGGEARKGGFLGVRYVLFGGEAGKPRKAVFLGMRYVLLGGGAYVILRFSAISLPAALSGLFVSVAAV